MKRFLSITAGIIVATIVMVSFTSVVFAQNQLEYTPLVPLPGITEPGSTKITNLSTYVVGMFQILIGLAALLAVVMIMIGGIEYMSTDAISGKSGGKAKITNALQGLLLAIASYLILNTIDPSFLNSDLKTTNTTTQQPGSGQTN